MEGGTFQEPLCGEFVMGVLFFNVNLYCLSLLSCSLPPFPPSLHL